MRYEIMRIASWVSSWATTLHIMFFERETYRVLREDFNPGDFMEVDEP